MKLALYPFQLECLDAFDEMWASGIQRGAAVLPTGTGKTVIMSEMTARFVKTTGKRVAIFVHRDELVKQTARKLKSADPDIRIGVVKASRNEIHNVDVVIISIQTLARRDRKRLMSIPYDHFGLLIVDECHHAAARSYTDALTWFCGFHAPFTHRALVAGFTATLNRADKLGLGDVFQKVAYKKDIMFAIRNGFLVDIKAKRITADDDLLDGVDVRGGDYTDSSLGSAMIAANVGELIAKSVREHVPDEQGVVFAPDVASAHQFSTDFEAQKFTNAVITGATPPDERDLVFKNFEAGHIQVLINCMVLTEGFDMPQISWVVPRCTRNVSLFIQMVGRGARLWKLHDSTSEYPWIRNPKTRCLVLDVMGATEHNKLACLADLSPTVRDVKDDESLTEAEDRELEDDFDDLDGGDNTPRRGKEKRGPLTAQDVDLFHTSIYAFRKTKRGFSYIPSKSWLIGVFPDTTAFDTGYSVWQIWTGYGKRQPSVSHGQDLDHGYALAIAESVAEELGDTTISLKKASWRKKKEPHTDAQARLARRFGIEFTAKTTKSELSDLIDFASASALLDQYPVKEAVSE